MSLCVWVYIERVEGGERNRLTEEMRVRIGGERSEMRVWREKQIYNEREESMCRQEKDS